MNLNPQQGFTLFYALLIASLALSIGVAIYDITERELVLSAASSQSQYAINAADTGAECALYWDNKYVNAGTKNNGGSNSAFATSSDSTYATSGLNCAGADVTTSSSWSVAQNASTGYATTTFSITLPATQSSSPCVNVTLVKKSGPPSVATVTANGLNTCNTGALQLERTLQVSY